MDQSARVWMILGAISGVLVSMAILVTVLACWQRNKRRLRGFSLRTTTPVTDAEFESWRRPSQPAYYSEKYGIRPSKPMVLQDQAETTLLKTELNAYQFGRSSNPTDPFSPVSPTASVQKPERARRKSSIASTLADRPPTPYSPIRTDFDFTRTSTSSRKSQPLIYYPSVSEASAFQFEFEAEYDTQQKNYHGWI